MLRLTFVWLLLIVGTVLAIQSTFNTLLFYLWFGYFRPDDWVWSRSIGWLGLSWWIGIFLVLRATVSPEAFRLDGRIALLLLLLLHSLISVTFSDYRAEAWPWWTDFAKCIVITHLVATLPNDRFKLRLVLMVITFSLGFESVKQGYAGLILHPGGKNWNSILFLGEENGVAIGMLMLVPVIAALGSSAKTSWERYLYRFMLIGVLYRGIVTYSRGGYVGCLALSVIYVSRSKQRLRTLISIAVLAAIILPVLPPAFWDRMNTITINEEEMDPSSAGRMHFWRVAMVMVEDRPFLGIGLNAYNYAFDDYDFLYGRMGTGKAVHSIWFGTLAELGYPGFLLVAANISLALLACRRVRRRALRGEVSEEVGRYAVALEAALWVAAISGTFSTFQYTEMLWHYVGLTIALETVANREATDAAAEKVEREEELGVGPTHRPSVAAFTRV